VYYINYKNSINYNIISKDDQKPVEMTQSLWKNSIIITNDVCIVYVNIIVTAVIFSDKNWRHYVRTTQYEE
jgi:hypothetical protein